MRILLLCYSFNSLTQRLHVELRERGHTVSVEFDINDAVTREAVELFRPDLVIAGFRRTCGGARAARSCILARAATAVRRRSIGPSSRAHRAGA